MEQKQKEMIVKALSLGHFDYLRDYFDGEAEKPTIEEMVVVIQEALVEAKIDETIGKLNLARFGLQVLLRQREKDEQFRLCEPSIILRQLITLQTDIENIENSGSFKAQKRIFSFVCFFMDLFRLYDYVRIS